MKIIQLLVLFGAVLGRSSRRKSTWRPQSSSSDDDEQDCYCKPKKTCCEKNNHKLKKVCDKIECINDELEPANITVSGGCIEQRNCDVCEQLPGANDEFACIKTGCEGKKEPRCFQIYEWYRNNQLPATYDEARRWATVNDQVILSKTAVTTDIYQLWPTSNKVMDGNRCQRCTFKIKSFYEDFLQYTSPKGDISTDNAYDEASDFYINFLGFVGTSAYFDTDPNSDLVYQDFVGYPVVTIDSTYGEYELMNFQ